MGKILKIVISFLAIICIVWNESGQTKAFANEAEIPEVLILNEDNMVTYGLLKHWWEATYECSRYGCPYGPPAAIYVTHNFGTGVMFHGWLDFKRQLMPNTFLYEGYLYPDDGKPLPQPTKIIVEEEK